MREKIELSDDSVRRLSSAKSPWLWQKRWWLPALDRKIAKLLASGCGTSEVAKKVGLSWSRINQLRRELKKSWEAFHELKEDERAQGELSVAA